tara:strand:- start:966 stop:1328 length:363 start_codon:yes stop_codon:yes gene_type:complete
MKSIKEFIQGSNTLEFFKRIFSASFDFTFWFFGLFIVEFASSSYSDQVDWFHILFGAYIPLTLIVNHIKANKIKEDNHEIRKRFEDKLGKEEVEKILSSGGNTLRKSFRTWGWLNRWAVD